MYSYVTQDRREPAWENIIASYASRGHKGWSKYRVHRRLIRDYDPIPISIDHICLKIWEWDPFPGIVSNINLFLAKFWTPICSFLDALYQNADINQNIPHFYVPFFFFFKLKVKHICVGTFSKMYLIEQYKLAPTPPPTFNTRTYCVNL